MQNSNIHMIGTLLRKNRENEGKKLGIKLGPQLCTQHMYESRTTLWHIITKFQTFGNKKIL